MPISNIVCITSQPIDDISDPKTLIRSLKNGLNVEIERQGYLSLDRNILAIMQPASRYLMQSSELQILYLEEDATPRLIHEQKSSKYAWNLEGRYLVRAWVQNGWSITIHSINQKGQIKLCLKSIEQIIGN